MEKVKGIIKKVGSTVSILIPSEAAEKLNLKGNQEVIIEIENKESVLRELFGSIKFSKPSKQLLKEAREELKSKFD
ncbi:MAG: AbrB/MazE/SpoVT family DNA-binding domain-containing protein [Candidatus Nanoarchaeia archaeon]